MSLDDVSGGRFLLGVGAGGSGWDATVLGVEPPLAGPAGAAARGVRQLLDLLLTQPVTTWHGEWFSAVEARMVPGQRAAAADAVRGRGQRPEGDRGGGPARRRAGRPPGDAARTAPTARTPGGAASRAWCAGSRTRAAAAGRDPAAIGRYLNLDSGPVFSLSSTRGVRGRGRPGRRARASPTWSPTGRGRAACTRATSGCWRRSHRRVALESRGLQLLKEVFRKSTFDACPSLGPSRCACCPAPGRCAPWPTRVRIKLLELVTLRGPLTASQCAPLVGESPSSCSFHLRQLAKYGYVEEAPGGDGPQPALADDVDRTPLEPGPRTRRRGGERRAALARSSASAPPSCTASTCAAATAFGPEWDRGGRWTPTGNAT